MTGPSGYSLAREDSLTYLDLHSVGGAKTSAAFSKEANWNDATNWCLEMWARIKVPSRITVLRRPCGTQTARCT